MLSSFLIVVDEEEEEEFYEEEEVNSSPSQSPFRVRFQFPFNKQGGWVGVRLVSRCLEPSQPLRIISGLKTNFRPSLGYSVQSSLNYKDEEDGGAGRGGGGQHSADFPRKTRE